MVLKTHYPSFDVMQEKDAWDDHTQAIVSDRNSMILQLQFLNSHEAEMLMHICRLLMNDNNENVLRFVIGHIDQTLFSSPGENQRKAGVPAESVLIRRGLISLDKTAQSNYFLHFAELNDVKRKQLLHLVSQGEAGPPNVWIDVPQQPFFQKLLNITLESYCSHPDVWSEIGYAGPAYPRGYVRAQLGQLDPWEAKREQ